MAEQWRKWAGAGLIGAAAAAVVAGVALSRTQKEVDAEIEIDATPEEVWGILTDFTSYPAWNPFIRFVEGQANVGNTLEVYLQPPGTPGMYFRPRVLVVEPNRELRWKGRLTLPRVFDSEQVFLIEPLEDGQRVRFIQRAIFTGMMIPFAWEELRVSARDGFGEMNTALKARAEAREE